MRFGRGVILGFLAARPGRVVGQILYLDGAPLVLAQVPAPDYQVFRAQASTPKLVRRERFGLASAPAASHRS